MIRIGIECESIEEKNHIWGVGRIIIKLLEELSCQPELENNYRFIIYFKNNVPDFEFLKSPIFDIKKVPVPFFKNRLFPIYYFVLLPMRLWFDRPNMMFWPNYMLPIIAFNKSIVMLTEDVYYEAYNNELPFRYRLAYKIFCWWAAKFATKIMAISETSKKNLVKLYGIKPEKIVVNHLGVGIDSNLESRISNLDHKLPDSRFQIPDSYILFVGQMFPRRHARETILAFEKLAKEFPELKLIMVGPDKYPKPTIKPLVEKINRSLDYEAVIHKDYVDNEDLIKLYANAKAIVYISDREAFGLPPMEALSFGVPPIVMDNELGHELFGENAFYSKSGSTDDVAEIIRKTLNEAGFSTMLRASKLEFVKKYNWNSFADKLLEVISNIKK